MMLSPPPERPLRRFSLFPQSPFARDLSPAEWLRSKCSSVLVRSKQSRPRWFLAVVAITALMGFSLPASASLGGRASTVESDRAQMNASHQVTQHDTYEVHEIQAPGGTVVDEYVSAAGTVFAVAWHGQFPPPMQQILGTYFEQYSNALQARPRMYGHRPVNIQEQGLVVQAGGHMRAHFGRAYDPNLLPQGFVVDQIQ